MTIEQLLPRTIRDDLKVWAHDIEEEIAYRNTPVPEKTFWVADGVFTGEAVTDLALHHQELNDRSYDGDYD